MDTLIHEGTDEGPGQCHAHSKYIITYVLEITA